MLLKSCPHLPTRSRRRHLLYIQILGQSPSTMSPSKPLKESLDVIAMSSKSLHSSLVQYEILSKRLQLMFQQIYNVIEMWCWYFGVCSCFSEHTRTVSGLAKQPNENQKSSRRLLVIPSVCLTNNCSCRRSSWLAFCFQLWKFTSRGLVEEQVRFPPLPLTKLNGPYWVTSSSKCLACVL